MGKAYFNRTDARMRINGTICMYDGTPMYVMTDGVEDDLSVSIMPPEDCFKHPKQQRRKTVKYTDDKFVYKSPGLGYVFFGGSAYYVSRIPDRKQRQGLSYEVIFVKKTPAALSIANDSILYSEAMTKSMIGSFPSLKEAIDLVISGEAESVPISRAIAIRKVARSTIALDYRTKFIGTRDIGDNLFKLLSFQEKPFLIKILAKEGIYTC